MENLKEQNLRLQDVISNLDQERDALQQEADEKTEKLIDVETSLSRRVSIIVLRYDTIPSRFFSRGILDDLSKLILTKAVRFVSMSG